MENHQKLPSKPAQNVQDPRSQHKEYDIQYLKNEEDGKNQVDSHKIIVNKNENDSGTAQNQEILTIINNDKNTEAALKQEIKSLNEKIELLSELLAKKDRLVHQLSNENRRFQEHYNLLATKVVEKDTIISTLERLHTRMEGFLKRHPNISKRTAEGVTSSSACISEQDIRNWFVNIYDYLKQTNLEDVLKDPSRIFNADESGFEICPSTGKVFAAKGTRNVYSVERGSSKENISVLFTFSSDGTTCVPIEVFPYQRIREKITKGINPKLGVGRSDKGWMTSETFYQYIANVFYPHLKENSIQLPVIVFLDGHKSHLNCHLSILCNELQIEIISLYPNATRILQPYDVSIFRPIKEAWRQSVRKWEEHPEQIVNKVVFGGILENAVNKSFKAETVVNGFKVCGLYPFNPDNVDYTKCLGVGTMQQPNIGVENLTQHKMTYDKFATIVGPKKIEMFQNIDGKTAENEISDEN
ncbi:unnamed protein product [Acanthoscelides obtectus]|uniref:DDE-1 domain-containing protein n=1 Tax=Acanthoscelides obtectus TaxID=200917 RepID=A0A9P0PWA0_ACAOB|nr:unnamed protein product [Acanthoscelides obtectus]CAK1655864.1 hypothetical protein AOBTE_LOCUS19398 [Acanthoscelides obtectus]